MKRISVTSVPVRIRDDEWRPALKVAVTVYTLVVTMMWVVSYYIADQHRIEHTIYNQSIGVFLIAYTCLTFYARYHGGGASYLYDSVWMCNIAMFASGLSLLLSDQSVIIAACVIAVSIDQACWHLDLISYILFGNFKIGVAKYVIWPHTPLVKKLTATHHIWFMWLAVSVIGIEAITFHAFILSCLTTTLLMVVSRVSIPYAYLDNDQQVRVLNINLAYAFWEDVKKPAFLHLFDHQHPLIYMPFISVIGNFVCNALPFAGFKLISQVMDSRQR